MKKSLVVIMLALSAAPAFADIPLPNHGGARGKLVTSNINGEAAMSLFQALNATEVSEGGTFSYTYAAKVERSAHGDAQVVCHLSSPQRAAFGKASASCVVTRSTDGSAVPAYRPLIRRG